MKRSIFLFWLGLWVLVACADEILDSSGKDPNHQGTDSGNAFVALTFSAEESLSQNQEALLARDENTAVLNTAVVGFKEIRLDACEDEAQADLYIGPLEVDLLTDDSLPQIEIPPATYCRLRLKVHKFSSEEETSVLGENSMVVRGVTQEGTAYEIRSRFNQNFNIEDESGVLEISAGLNHLQIVFDFKAWVEALDIDELPLSEGRVMINDDYNEEKLDDFEEQVKSAAKLLRHGEGDSANDGSDETQGHDDGEDDED